MNTETRPLAEIPKWSLLLVEAVNKPGLIMEAYSAFSQLLDRKSDPRAGPMPDARVATWTNQHFSRMASAGTQRQTR